MFCKNCGAQLPDGSEFCAQCGTKLVTKADEPAKADKKRKNLVGKILLFLLALICVAGAFFAGLMYNGGEEKGCYEGEGFESAEEAMQAFAEAFAAKDIDEMYADCAIESYVNGYDYAAYHNWIRAYTPVSKYVSGSDEASDRLNCEIRRNNLTNSFYNMYLTASSDEDSRILKGLTIPEDEEDVNSILKMLKGPDAIDEIEVINITDADEYTNFTDSINKTIDAYEDIYGGKLKPLVAKLTIDGEEWLLFADVIEYDDRWYVLTPHGLGAAYLGMPVTSGGIIREDTLH